MSHFSLCAIFCLLNIFTQRQDIPCRKLNESCSCNSNLNRISCHDPLPTSEFPNLTVLVNETNLKGLALINKFYREIVDNAFRNLAITQLNLSSNKLEHFSDKAFDGLTSLQYLTIYNNKIKSINFSSLVNIVSIDLNQNDLRIVKNATFLGLGQLNVLDLSQNKITDIEQNGFASLKRLLLLSLDKNEIKFFRPILFINQIFLEKSNLSENLIEVIPQGCFKGLVDVKVLELQKNQIKFIESGAFVGLDKITASLRLESQNLNNLEANSFFGLKIKSLFLMNNFLTVVNNLTFANLQVLNVLDLTSNKKKLYRAECF
jgi:Leucine-rich repeat (LRR) protein